MPEKRDATFISNNKEGKRGQERKRTHTQPGNKTNPNLGYGYLKKGLINERKGTDYVKGGNMQTTIADFI